MHAPETGKSFAAIQKNGECMRAGRQRSGGQRGSGHSGGKAVHDPGSDSAHPGKLKDKIVVSVAAGYPFEKLEQALLPGTHHLSTCPNTPVAVAEGIIVCEDKHSLTGEEFQMVKDLFEKIALVETVDTAHLSVAGTVCGCTPAYAAMFIEALGDAGVKHGLTRAQAYRFAAQMLVGTGKLHLETGSTPAR